MSHPHEDPRTTEVELTILKIFRLAASYRAFRTLKDIVFLLVLLVFFATALVFSLYFAPPTLMDARAAQA